MAFSIRFIFVLNLLASAGFALDLDLDGLDDAFEQKLLERFRPKLRLSSRECDGAPAEFRPGLKNPQVVARGGVLYGQATPRRLLDTRGAHIELRYFHLWANDCGKSRHPLDIEHLAVLVAADKAQRPANAWKAEYWYAAAHEGTVCDAGMFARAKAIKATKKGPTVWVSAGKHASYLRADQCLQGCGSDDCSNSAAMAPGRLVNLGEPEAPLNGALWIQSPVWRFKSKMQPRFTPELLARFAVPGRPDYINNSPKLKLAQTIIAIGAFTADTLGTVCAAPGMAASANSTCNTLSLAAASTADALSGPAKAVSGSLKKSARGVGSLLGIGQP